MKTRSIHPIRLAIAAVTLGVVALTNNSLCAAKPGGDGSSGPVGTIYFYSPPYYGDGHFYSMKADGTQKTQLGITGNASPSRLMHGGKRWFLQMLPVPGPDILGNERSENFAVREDGAVAVQLTDDPAMHINLDWAPLETGSEAVVAGLGRRWNADGTPDVSSMGMYAATLRFDADGNVLGLDGSPSFLVSIGVVDPDGTGFLTWDCYPWTSFSPDMTRLVIDHYEAGTGLRIVDVATGNETPLVSGWTRSPAWSPDGSKITFIAWSTTVPARIDVVAPNGSNRATVFKARWMDEWLYSPTWSPDSTHLAFRFSKSYPYEDEVYRVSASGGKAVNLTGDISLRAYLMGWR